MMRLRSLLLIASIVAVTLPGRAQQAGTPGAGIQRRILVEMYTATWCGPCVASADVAQSLRDTYQGYAIPVGIHVPNGDRMVIPEGDSLRSLFGITGVPLYIYDRRPVGPIGALEIPAVVTVAIDHSYIPSTRTVSATVKAEFIGRADTGDMRLNLYVVEDSVTGTGWGYDQLNGYDLTTTSPYYGLGEEIKGYAHRYVLRGVPSGVLGTAGVIPSDPPVGVLYAHTYTYTLPANHNPERTRLVAFVSKAPSDSLNANEEVLNTTEALLIPQVSSAPTTTAGKLEISITPMPIGSSGQIRLALPEREDVTVEITDMLGRRVSTIARGEMEAGEHHIPLDASDLRSGAYSLVIRTGQEVTSRTIIVAQ